MNVDDKVMVEEVYENYLIVKGEGKYLIYNNDYEIKEGNTLYIKGELIPINHSYNSFYNFMNKQGINYLVEYEELIVVDRSSNFNVLLVDGLLENKSEANKKYLKTILFNIKDESNKEFYEMFSFYSITYLIAISGFHIRVLLSFFKKIFKRDFIGFCFVGFYLYLLKFSVSSYRAYLCYIFKKVNKKLNFDLSNVDVVSLIGIVFILINPSNMFSYGFIFSFTSCFVLEIFNVSSRNKIKTMLNVYLVNLPLILLNYYKINVLSVVLSLVLSVPISFIYLFSIVYLFLDKFHVLYFITIKGLEKTFSFLSNFDLELVFGKPHIAVVLMYYLFLLLFFVYSERKKRIRKVYFVCALSVILFQYFIPCCNVHEQVYFLNVGQGDCTVFIIPESKSAVLFDTGGSKYKDIAVKEIIPFLYSKGINKIDKVIISHDDYDHVGALESLQDNFDVGEIVENSMFKSVMIGKEEFVNLNVSEMRDNDGSVVLYGKYGGYNLLLMGDASSLIELKVMNNVNNVDILKVAHHGSRDSSCMEFLMKIRGKIAIISVGKNNSYKHPHEDVLDNLNKAGYLMLRTDENNDIGFGRNLFGLRFVDYFS